MPPRKDTLTKTKKRNEKDSFCINSKCICVWLSAHKILLKIGCSPFPTDKVIFRNSKIEIQKFALHWKSVLLSF